MEKPPYEVEDVLAGSAARQNLCGQRGEQHQHHHHGESSGGADRVPEERFGEVYCASELAIAFDAGVTNR